MFVTACFVGMQTLTLGAFFIPTPETQHLRGRASMSVLTISAALITFQVLLPEPVGAPFAKGNSKLAVVVSWSLGGTDRRNSSWGQYWYGFGQQ